MSSWLAALPAHCYWIVLSGPLLCWMVAPPFPTRLIRIRGSPFEWTRPCGVFHHTLPVCTHRFEWTRAEFEAWASQLASTYGYTVAFKGVGRVVEELQPSGGGGEDAGCATQVAVFVRQ